MPGLAILAIQLAVVWAVCTGIVWFSVRLVGRRLKVIDAASVAFVGSLLSLGAFIIPLGSILGLLRLVQYAATFVIWAVLLLLACRLSPGRAAVSSLIVLVLNLIAFHFIR